MHHQEDHLLGDDCPLPVYEIWERTADKHGEKVIPIHDTKILITVGDLSVTCTFCYKWVTNSTPILRVECQTSRQLTYRVQRWINVYMDEVWPPRDRRTAINFINMLLLHIQARFRDRNSYCAVCDTNLEYPGCKALPCTDPLCVFTFEELDYADTLHSYSSDSPIPHLVAIFAYSAVSTAGQTRLQAMFSSLPTAFLLENKNLHWTRVESALQSLIPEKWFEKTLNMDSEDGTLILKWLMATNRSELRTVATDNLLPMGSSLQFEIFLGDIASEHRFQQLKVEHGSVYAFHGSSFHNWYGILRRGLKNWSNTPLMSTGAAHGPGIYTALSSGMASSYCGRFDLGWKCIALCEIAKCPNNFSSSTMIVVPNDEAVSLRFLIVYKAKESIPNVVAETLRTHAAVQGLEITRSKYVQT